MLGTNEEWATVPYAAGWERAIRLLNATRGLVARGYDDAGIAEILGENWLRVFGDVCG